MKTGAVFLAELDERFSIGESTIHGAGKGELLNALDRDVEIIIKPKTKEEKFATAQVLFTTTP